MLVQRDNACLLIVDVQARLLPAMADRDEVVKNAAVLLKAAARLDIPVIASEQYPKGLGPTVPEIARSLPAGATVIEKMSFSCLADETFARRLRELGRTQVVVAGIEAHVCVLQTAEQLIASGHDVFVVADATSSRTPASHDLAMARLARAGCTIVSTEMVVFEWMQVAGTPEFRELSALIK
jgi:nicotinamidase-related amidase